MVRTSVLYLAKLAKFLNVQPGKINIGSNSSPERIINKSSSPSSYGYLNIISQLINEANSSLDGQNLLEKAEIRQWIEYAIVYAAQIESQSHVNQVLTELNSILTTRTYLIAHRLTVADVFLFYILHEIMVNLSILDKEKYVHVSRWFDNLQEDPKIRQSNKLIEFNTLFLTTIAPLKMYLVMMVVCVSEVLAFDFPDLQQKPPATPSRS